MVLTDRQRADLHASIYEYLNSSPPTVRDLSSAASALAAADPECAAPRPPSASSSTTSTTLIEKKWTAVSRLQKRVLELERQLAAAVRHGFQPGEKVAAGSTRRLLPRAGAAVSLAGHSGPVTRVSLHPITTVCASAGEDGSVRLWDHEGEGAYIRTLRGHTGPVNSTAFSPDGTLLASCSSDLSVKLWDMSNYTCARTLRGHDHTISDAVFIPAPAESSGVAGASSLVTASRDCSLKFWDLETGYCTITVTGRHTDWVRCLAARCDGQLVASAGNDRDIHVHVANGANRGASHCILQGHEHVVESVAFLTGPSAAAAGDAARWRRWAQKAGDAADYLASGGRDRTVRLWTTSGGGNCLRVFGDNENWVRGVAVHPSGEHVLSCGDDRSIRVFDIKTDRCLRTIDAAHSHFVSSVAIHWSLPMLVTGGIDQTVRCWRLD